MSSSVSSIPSSANFYDGPDGLMIVLTSEMVENMPLLVVLILLFSVKVASDGPFVLLNLMYSLKLILVSSLELC